MTFPASVQDLNRRVVSGEPHQSAILRLGELALSDTSLADLMNRAAALLAQVLSVEFVWLWELEQKNQTLRLRASKGWQQASSEELRKPLELHSIERLTLNSRYPVIVEDAHKDTRFESSPLLRETGAVSGVCVSIGTSAKPFGVIEAFGRQMQLFSQDDILFLQNAANLLALAVGYRLGVDLQAQNGELGRQLAGIQADGKSRQPERDLYEIRNRLIESRERERLRLAQELHDAPIQDLYGLIYQSDDLKEILKDPAGEQVVDQYNQILHNIVNSLRAICRELRPPSLSPFGLEVAIRDHAEKIREQSPHLRIHLLLMSDQQVLSDNLRLNLFRVYQQAISNVLRHAEATEIRVRFGWDDDIIFLEVQDNGKGFEVPANWVEFVRGDHFGLVGLAERVEAMHGKLEVVSATGAGTRIRAIVPRHLEETQPRS